MDEREEFLRDEGLVPETPADSFRARCRGGGPPLAPRASGSVSIAPCRPCRVALAPAQARAAARAALAGDLRAGKRLLQVAAESLSAAALLLVDFVLLNEHLPLLRDAPPAAQRGRRPRWKEIVTMARESIAVLLQLQPQLQGRLATTHRLSWPNALARACNTLTQLAATPQRPRPRMAR